jgi:hypothetical protein
MFVCPVCGTQAKDITSPGFDGIGVRCKEHGDFEVSGTALSILAGASLERWADALGKAKRAASAGKRVQINSYML